MADEPDKKKDKKESKGVEIAEILILLAFIVGIAVVWGFSSYYSSSQTYLIGVAPAWIVALKTFIGIVDGFAIIICIMLILGIFIAGVGLKDVRHHENKKFQTKIEEALNTEAKGDPGLTVRWRKILEATDSTNDNDWRQAIIDADSILDEIVQKMGYLGDSLGERLRNADKGDFKTLDLAGEAHGVRNRIAHDGSSFLLNQQETKRIIGLYKQVFTEFFYI